MTDPLSTDILDLARRVRGLYLPGESGRELAEAILVQCEDEMVLSPSGEVGKPFVVRYLLRHEPGRIEFAVNGCVVFAMSGVRAHWFASSIVLVPGVRVAVSEGVRLLGRSVTPREALQVVMAGIAYTVPPMPCSVSGVVDFMECPKCGHAGFAEGEACYRCGRRPG